MDVELRAGLLRGIGKGVKSIGAHRNQALETQTAARGILVALQASLKSVCALCNERLNMLVRSDIGLFEFKAALAHIGGT